MIDMMRSVPLSVIIALGICLVLMMQACSAPPAPAVDAGPVDGPHGFRSMAFDSAAQRDALAVNPIYTAPWYASRNDNLPSVTVGYESPRVESTFVRTYDFQTQTSGRVFDNFRQNTYTTSARESIQR